MAKAKFDSEQWKKEIVAARDDAKPSQEEESAHLTKLQMWIAGFAVLGMLMAARGVISPTAMVLLCLFKQGQFCILAHHSLHGGFGRHRRGWYAKGCRRAVDWLDWILPEAWNVEHNKEHHYKLNEYADPDRPDRNTKTISSLPLPYPVKYVVAFFLASTWKWMYYASNTLKLLHAENEGAPKDFDEPIMIYTVFARALAGDSKRWHLRLMIDFVIRDMGPPLLLQYVAYPLVVGLLRGFAGLPVAFGCAVLNIAGAEILANLLQFATIVTNHSGSDLFTFKDPCRADSAEFYLRATLGSTAYHSGNDFIDYFHGYLNYQAEHHCWPDLSPLHYQRLHPAFKKICTKHGVNYIQEPVWTRTRKTVDVMVGKEHMKEIDGQAVDQPEIWATPMSSKED